MTSLPAWAPRLSCTPMPGPVAYHVHCGFFTSVVISRGVLQVLPLSSLCKTQTVRVPLDVPSTICFSTSSPRLCVQSSQSLPVDSSSTAQGLPQVFFPSAQTTWSGENVVRPSVDRFSTTLISPESLPLLLRPSA